MMKRSILAIILSMLTTILCAQSGVVTGVVMSGIDSTQIAGATVMVKGGSPSAMCRADGSFTLSGVKYGSDTIEVNFIGFKILKVNINIDKAKTNLGSIFMREVGNTELGEVVVIGQQPIAQLKGDTTQFNAAAYKTHPDADADQLLEKMPGVVIQDGKIEAQGEPIRKIYVDGTLFFGTDPMAALKSLPADAIESVQLFDDMSDQARFTGFDDGQTQKSINIVTKTKSKTMTIYKAEAAGGADIDNRHKGRYLTGGNFSHFGPKQRITVTGIVNNINTVKFGQSELEQLDDNGNPLNHSLGMKKIAGVGMNYSLQSKKVRLTATYSYDNTSNDLDRTSYTSYYASPPKFDSKEVFRESVSHSNIDNHAASGKFEWSINPRNSIVIAPRITVRSDDAYSNAFSLTTQDNDSLNRTRIETPSRYDAYSLSGYALWTHRFLKRGRTISTNLYYSASNRESDRYQHYLMRENYKNNGWITPSESIDRNYDQVTTGNVARLKITYSEPLATKHRLLISAVGSKDWGKDDKRVDRYDAQGDFIVMDSVQSSYFERDYNSYGGGLGYSFQSGEYRFSTGADYLRLEQKRDEQMPNQVVTKRDFNDIQPTAMLRYRLDKRRYLRFNYRGKSVLPRIEQMQDVIDDSSPSNVRLGNPSLKQGYQHGLTLFYNATNVERSTNFSLSVDARTISNYVAQSTQPIGDSILIPGTVDEYYIPKNSGAFFSQWINLDGYIYSRAEGTFSIALKSIRSNLNLTGSYGYVRMPSIYGELNYANTHTAGIRVGLTSNISQNVDFNLYSNTVISHTQNTSKENSSFINQNVYLSTNIIFWKGFVFNTLFTWRYYTKEGLSEFDESYYLLNAGLGKKLFKKQNGEVRFTVYDILKQNRNISQYVRNNSTEEVYTNSMGRYFMIRMLYRFNSQAHGKAANARKVSGDNFKIIDQKELRELSKRSKN